MPKQDNNNHDHPEAGPSGQINEPMKPYTWLPWAMLIVGFAIGLAVERYFMPSPLDHPDPVPAVQEQVQPLLKIGEPRDPSVMFHTISDPPSVKIFQTEFNGETLVRFDHDLHSDLAECIQCHHVESCSKCHLKNETQILEIEEGKIAFHQNCLQCHEETAAADPKDCEFCHVSVEDVEVSAD